MIDNKSAVPAYLQVQDVLKEEILKGLYKPEEIIPSESQLCQKFGVSRITVRNALSRLEHQGLIYTVHGKGRYVKMPQITQNLSQLTSFKEVFSQEGLSGYTKIHSFTPAVLDDEQNTVSRLCLVGYIQETPVVYYDSLFSCELGQAMYEEAQKQERKKAAFSTLDLYETLGIRLCRVEQSISATVPKKIKGVFGTKSEGALLVLESSYFTDQDVLTERKIGYYRPDVYRFSIKREI